ncbi:MAG: polysaccharide deacetylase family protein [Verrucomicrobia bacterium]|nr:polysaccharide deacetylase family protein [Verrucomicrobiota bacterium]
MPNESTKRQACIVFSSDDGHRADYEKLGPLARDLNVPFVLGIVSGHVGTNPGSMTLEQIRQMAEWGCELAAHSVSHPKLALLPESKKREEIEGSFAWLRAHGWPAQHFIYPFGGQDVTSERIIRSIARSACLIKGGVTYPPFFSTRIPRWPLGSYFRDGIHTFEGYRKLIDKARSDRRMLVWMLHPGSPRHDAEQQSILVRLIEYCRSNGIRITTLTEALDVHGNLWESPVNFGREIVIDCDGVVWFAKMPILLRPLQRWVDSRAFAMMVYAASRVLRAIKSVSVCTCEESGCQAKEANR